MTPNEGREKGTRRAERGIQRASHDHQEDIERDTLKFLDVLLSSPDGTATMDSATDDLSERFRDGGRWRASIPKRLKAEGLIVAERVVKSSRPARHAGYVTEWRVTDRSAADRRREVAREFLRSNPFRPPSNSENANGSVEKPTEPLTDFQI